MDLGLGFDQAAIGMALVGLNGRFLRVNRALCELLGRSEAELLGSAITDLGEPGDDPVLADLGRAATRQGGQAAFQVERSCRRADGTRLDLLRGDQPEAAADFERLLPARSCGPSARSATSSSTSTTGPCSTPTAGSPAWSAWPWT